MSGESERVRLGMNVDVDVDTVSALVPRPAEARTCSRLKARGSKDSPESTALGVPTALKCVSGASKVLMGPGEHGAQTSRAQKMTLAPS